MCNCPIFRIYLIFGNVNSDWRFRIKSEILRFLSHQKSENRESGPEFPTPYSKRPYTCHHVITFGWNWKKIIIIFFHSINIQLSDLYTYNVKPNSFRKERETSSSTGFKNRGMEKQVSDEDVNISTWINLWHKFFYFI